MRRFLHWWLDVPASTWLLRAFLLSAGIEAAEGIHGWPRLIPVVLGVTFLFAWAREEIRERRSPAAP
jgi:hypothetical protein